MCSRPAIGWQFRLLYEADVNETRAMAFERSFFLGMALIVVLGVVLGFRFTINQNLIHPDWPRPWILWIHGVLFATWILLFLVQTYLVRNRNMAGHRSLGAWGIGVGAAIPVVGIAVSVVMARTRAQHGEADAAGFLPIGFMDMLTFAVAFGLGAILRRNREAHRRLMFVATCALAAAGLLRVFQPMLPGMYSGSLGASVLIMVGMARDLLVDRRIHPVYLMALPLYVIGEGIAIYLNSSPGWLAVGNTFIR